MTLRELVAQAGLGCLLTSPEAPLTLSTAAIPSFVVNNCGGVHARLTAKEYAGLGKI